MKRIEKSTDETMSSDWKNENAWNEKKGVNVNESDVEIPKNEKMKK